MMGVQVVLFMIASSILWCEPVWGHGWLKDPVSRSSLWRIDSSIPERDRNYNDNQLFCGGLSVSIETYSTWIIYKLID